MKELSQEEFGEAISAARAVVDFYTDICAPCKQMLSVLEIVQAQRTDVAFFKVNAQANGQLSAEYGVRGVPTFFLMEHGTVKGQKTGTMTPTQMIQWIDDCLAQR